MMSEDATEPGGSLRVGDDVCLAWVEGRLPYRTTLGTVVAVDALGIRLAVIHPASGYPAGVTMFAPWTSVAAALVRDQGADGDVFSREVEAWSRGFAQEADA
jgi:hypothetical protein